MPKENYILLQLEVSFLILFALITGLLFGTVGLIVAALSLALMFYIVYVHGKQKPQTPSIDKNQEIETQSRKQPIYREDSEKIEYGDDKEYEDSTDADLVEYELEDDDD